MTNNEEWRPVVGYEGLYEVSNRARVRRIAAARGVIKEKLPRLLNPHFSGGYHQVSVCRGGRAKPTLVYRLVAAAFLGPRPSGAVTNHKDGNKANSVVENLEYCSHQENTRHAVGLGLNPSGERHGRRKLSLTQVEEMRRRRADGEGARSLARAFGVSWSQVYRILGRELWRNERCA